MLRTMMVGVCMLVAGCGIVDPPVRGSGKLTTEKRGAESFTAIELYVSTAMDIKKGDVTSVELTIDDNLLPLITTKVEGNTLTIRSDKNLAPSDAAKITITVPTISVVSVAGASKVTIEELSGPKTELSLAGSSEVAGTVNSESLECDIAGSGKITMSGASKSVAISVAGSGELQMQKLIANSVTIDIAGSGTAFVHADSSLKVSIAGSGDVSYSGKAKVEQSIAGSGSVKQIPDAPADPQPASKEPATADSTADSDESSSADTAPQAESDPVAPKP